MFFVVYRIWHKAITMLLIPSVDTTIPSHWYRMKAFDAMGSFGKCCYNNYVFNLFQVHPAVCENACHARTTATVTLPVFDVLSLPTLLSLLNQEHPLTLESETIVQSCELYKLARYGDGVSKLFGVIIKCLECT